MKINKDSWHYNLAVDVANLNYVDLLDGKVDSCKYKSYVIAGAGIVVASVFFVLVMAFIWITFSFLPLISDNFWWAISVASVAWYFNYKGIVGIVTSYKDLLPNWMFKNILKSTSKKEPSFISDSWTEFKEKYCSKVEITDKK